MNAAQCMLHFDKPQQKEIHSLNKSNIYIVLMKQDAQHVHCKLYIVNFCLCSKAHAMKKGFHNSILFGYKIFFTV